MDLEAITPLYPQGYNEVLSGYNEVLSGYNRKCAKTLEPSDYGRPRAIREEGKNDKRIRDKETSVCQTDLRHSTGRDDEVDLRKAFNKTIMRVPDDEPSPRQMKSKDRVKLLSDTLKTTFPASKKDEQAMNRVLGEKTPEYTITIDFLVSAANEFRRVIDTLRKTQASRLKDDWEKYIPSTVCSWIEGHYYDPEIQKKFENRSYRRSTALRRRRRRIDDTNLKVKREEKAEGQLEALSDASEFAPTPAGFLTSAKLFEAKHRKYLLTIR